MMTTQEIVKALEDGGFDALLTTLDPETIELMNRATDLFERYPVICQMVTLAIMFGTACGSIEGEPTEYEVENRTLLSYEDRLRIFEAMSRITFDASMKVREDPRCPQPRRM